MLRLLLRLDLRLPQRRGRGEPDQPTRLQRLHLRRVLPRPRDGRERLRPDPFVLLLQRMDPEYSVIGRVARRISAIALRDKYGANEHRTWRRFPPTCVLSATVLTTEP